MNWIFRIVDFEDVRRKSQMKWIAGCLIDEVNPEKSRKSER